MIDATASMSASAAFAADAVTATDVEINSNAIVRLGDRAFLKADDVHIAADNAVDATSSAYGLVQVDIASATVTAISRVCCST